MTDLEMTRLCAEAMGQAAEEISGQPQGMFLLLLDDDMGSRQAYQPLHNDAQCMALVKKFQLSMSEPIKESSGDWVVFKIHDMRPFFEGRGSDINRAIVECVAKMQKAKP